ncbi:hypothetical protein [Subdoligranulum variabile]|uniref:hypothetical protein n=1 Tax=Subdoligranulum variabile TaxID=214851 RepID=UPI0026F29F77|nr:hypothetical protein [Subdoligranulum variabile]
MKFCIIVPLARCVVKFACVAAGVYGFMALGALNVPALICAVLALNALLGLWFALECKKAAPDATNIQHGKAVMLARVTAADYTRIGGKAQ